MMLGEVFFFSPPGHLYRVPLYRLCNTCYGRAIKKVNVCCWFLFCDNVSIQEATSPLADLGPLFLTRHLDKMNTRK